MSENPVDVIGDATLPELPKVRVAGKEYELPKPAPIDYIRLRRLAKTEGLEYIVRPSENGGVDPEIAYDMIEAGIARLTVLLQRHNPDITFDQVAEGLEVDTPAELTDLMIRTFFWFERGIWENPTAQTDEKNQELEKKESP